MRVLITGASGFVGTWLSQELKAHGHQIETTAPDLDVRDSDAISTAVLEARPDAIAHLAAVSYAPQAAADPQEAYSVSLAGTVSVFEAVRVLPKRPIVLVTGSSEVYGPPRPSELPIGESTQLRGRSVYALSKIGQEAIATAYSVRYDIPVVVTRSFNHTGPGQRADFVVAALAQRIARAVAAGEHRLSVGNLDVRRDIADVRDVVRAYRLLIERSAASGPLVVNVCSGSSVTIRWIAEELLKLAGVDLELDVDPALVRPQDAPEIRGDHRLLTELTGWEPTIGLSSTLADVWRSVRPD